MQNIIKMVP